MCNAHYIMVCFGDGDGATTIIVIINHCSQFESMCIVQES